MNNIKPKTIISYLLMLPSLLIGTMAMISFGVASSIWIQNIIIWILGVILGCVFLIKSRKQNLSKNHLGFTIMIIIALLILPFWFNGLDGVHRWLSFGPIKIYAASVFLPLLIIHLWKLTLSNHVLNGIGLTIIVLVILLFHPDAGQVTAFAGAAALILWKKINSSSLKLLNLTLITTSLILSWIFLDDLAPVPYVEHIIFLVADMGGIWFILGIMSLLLLLFPFFFYNKEIISLSLGVYFLLTMIVTFFGNFPMPIMGYGTSPIIGYLIAITWLNSINI